MNKPSKKLADIATRKNKTRALIERLEEYCERYDFVMPDEFLIAVMNGVDPRPDSNEPVPIGESIQAAKTFMPYIYARQSDITLSGDVGVHVVPRVEADPDIVVGLIDKVKDAI